MPLFGCCCRVRSSKPEGPEPESKTSSPLPVRPTLTRTPRDGPLSLHPVATLSMVSDSQPRPSIPLPKPLPITPVETIELGQLADDELLVDESDSDDEAQGSRKNKSTSTLIAVKTRIRRHLSQDSFARRKDSSSMCLSTEQIARRAELKRLMHKRIRDELGYDKCQDLRSKKASSDPHPTTPAWETSTVGRFSEGIHFPTMGTSHTPGPSPIANADTPRISPTDAPPGTDENAYPDRRASCPESLPTRQVSTRPACRAIVRERTSLPLMLPSPEVAPTAPPNTHRDSASLASWRPSYGSGQLQEFLVNGGDLGVVRPSPIKLVDRHARNGQTLLESATILHSLRSLSSSRFSLARISVEIGGSLEQDPMETWLRSQYLQTSLSAPHLDENEGAGGSGLQNGSRCFSPSKSLPQNGGVVDGGGMPTSSPTTSRRPSASNDPTAANGEISVPETVHLYDMDIHGQLDTQAPNSPEDSSGWSTNAYTHVRRGSIATNASEYCDYQRPGLVLDSSEPGPPYGRVSGPNGVSNSIRTVSSSRYPSTLNSADHSPMASAHHLPGSGSGKPDIFHQSRYSSNGNPYSNVGGEKSEYSSWESGLYGAVYAMASAEARRNTTSSLVIPSETSSQRQREAELQSIEKRFGRSHLRRGPTTPVVSKFREEFDLPDHPLMSKPSILSRLHLSVPKKVKLIGRGLDGVEDRRLGPSPLSRYFASVGTTNVSRPISKDIFRSQDILSGLCHLPSEAGSRLDSGSGNRQGSPIPRRDNSDIHAANDSPPTSHGIRQNFDEYAFKKSPDRSNNVLEDWSRELRHREHVVKSRSRVVTLDKQPVRKTSFMPEAGPRYPSHTAAQRNASARSADGVVQESFASLAVSQQGTVEGSTDKTSTASERKPDMLSVSSISGRLGKVVKTSFSRLMPTKAVIDGDIQKSNIGFQRGDARSEQQVQYPKLMLLPRDKRIEVLERQGEQMKSASAGDARRPYAIKNNVIPRIDDNRSSDKPRRSTMPRHADTSSDYKNHRHSSSADQSGAVAPPDRAAPATPAHPAAHDKGSTTTTEQYVTPMSRLSLTNSSLHSHSLHSHSLERSNTNSRPQSWSLAPDGQVAPDPDASGPNASGLGEDANSVRSDVTVIRKGKALTEPDLRGPYRNTNARGGKHMTWSGRAKTHPPAVCCTSYVGARELTRGGEVDMDREGVTERW